MLDELCCWFREAGYVNLVVLPSEKSGRFLRWADNRNLLIGSGVNVLGTKTKPSMSDASRATEA